MATSNANRFDIAKAVTFLLIFLAIAVGCITVLLVPALREYKKQNDIYSIEYATYKKAKDRYDDQNAKIISLKTENKQLLAALNKKTDEQAIKEVAKNYFQRIDVKQIGSLQQEKEFFYEDYNVTTAFTSPKDLFGFLKALSVNNAVVKVNTPLIMAQGNKTLLSNFVLRIYYLNLPQSAKHK